MNLEEYTQQVEVEVGEYYLATVEIEAHEEDASFDHEFGTQEEKELVVDSSEIVEFIGNNAEPVEPTEEQKAEAIQKAEEKFPFMIVT